MGEKSEDSSWPITFNMCKYFYLHASFHSSVKIHTRGLLGFWDFVVVVVVVVVVCFVFLV